MAVSVIRVDAVAMTVAVADSTTGMAAVTTAWAVTTSGD